MRMKRSASGLFSDQPTHEAAKEIGERVAKAPRGIGLIKRAVNHANLPNLESDLEYEAYLQEIAGRSSDYDEGVRAFLEKRTPAFTGK